MVSNNRDKIHQTWERPHRYSLYTPGESPAPDTSSTFPGIRNPDSSRGQALESRHLDDAENVRMYLISIYVIVESSQLNADALNDVDEKRAERSEGLFDRGSTNKWREVNYPKQPLIWRCSTCSRGEPIPQI